MTEVLSQVEAHRLKARQRAEREQQQAETERKARETAAREASESAEKEQAFNNAFPDEEQQHEIIAELLAGLPFSPTTQVGRIVAIGRWWDCQSSH